MQIGRVIRKYRKSINMTQEAYKMYEELLFSNYQMTGALLYGMYSLAVQEKDMSRAHLLVKKQEEAARLFEMGRYHEVCCKLELATLEEDAETAVTAMQQMISGLEQICGFRQSPLYEHMDFKETAEEFSEELRKDLLNCFRDEDSYGFLKNDKRWQALITQE